MLPAIIAGITSLLGTAIDKAIPDKDQAEQLKNAIMMEVLKGKNKELEGAVSIITAEAQGESWLQRNWRPLTMLFLVGLIGAHWLGFTPENLTPEEISGLMEIVKIGLGG